jgi:hypothetical protein
MAWRHCEATKSGAGRSGGSHLRRIRKGRSVVVLPVDLLVVLLVDPQVDLLVGARIATSAASAHASAVCGFRGFQRSLRQIQFGTLILLSCRLGGRRSH